jgi:ribosome-binding protein aMBF1 (putative translation factor)
MDAEAAPMAVEESVEDELGDSDMGQGGEESEEEERQNSENGDAENAQGETGGVFIGEDLPKNYHERLREARQKIKGLLGITITKDPFAWTVIDEYHSDDLFDSSSK